MVKTIGEMYVIIQYSDNGKEPSLFMNKLYKNKKDAVDFLRSRIYDMMGDYINDSYFKMEIGDNSAAIVDMHTDVVMLLLTAVEVNSLAVLDD